MLIHVKKIFNLSEFNISRKKLLNDTNKDQVGKIRKILNSKAHSQGFDGLIVTGLTVVNLEKVGTSSVNVEFYIYNAILTEPFNHFVDKTDVKFNIARKWVFVTDTYPSVVSAFCKRDAVACFLVNRPGVAIKDVFPKGSVEGENALLDGAISRLKEKVESHWFCKEDLNGPLDAKFQIYDLFFSY